MALEPLNLNLTFTEAEPDPNDERDESTWPTVKLDITGVETLIQPLVLRLMSLVREEAINRGAKFNFEVSA